MCACANPQISERENTETLNFAPSHHAVHYTTLSSVVMARVAILLLLSDMRLSRSTLHEVTASGWIIAILLSVFTEAKRMVGLADVKNI